MAEEATALRVWAPRAELVELVLGAERLAMGPCEDGWWEAPRALPPGTDYRFSLDGGAPLPDPRSPYQPEGVHGPSRTVDLSGMAWTDAGWRGTPLASAVIYELHVGTFSPEGTFDGVIARLPHLVDLGVTAVELMPVAEFPGRRGWGYDGVDLYAPHHGYGGPDGLRRLVDACHAHGLGVVLDVVYNHLGPDGNYLGAYGPYFTDRYQTPWGQALNVDGPDSDEVRAFVIENALMWLRDYHIDGLRLDAIHAIVDTSATHLLEEMRARVARLERRLGRTLWLIAESDLNDPRIVRSPEAGGYGIDAQWSDDLHHALHAALTGERDGYYADFGSLADVAEAVRHAFVYAGRHSRHRRRRHGRPPTGLPGRRFLGYIQNHDQVGNRALGERTAALTDPAGLRIAAALVLTSPFVPMLFQGEEWGASTPFQYFTEHGDPELARLVTEGRRREFEAFGWPADSVPDPQDEATFARSVLRWDELEQEPHAGLLRWHRDLIRLRRTVPDLADDRLDAVAVDVDEEAGTLVVRRGAVVVACTLAGPATVDPGVAAGGRVLVASVDPAPAPEGRAVELPGRAVVVWQGPR